MSVLIFCVQYLRNFLNLVLGKFLEGKITFCDKIFAYRMSNYIAYVSFIHLQKFVFSPMVLYENHFMPIITLLC